MANKNRGTNKDLIEEQADALTVGEFAHQVIAEQFRRVVKRQKEVLADKDPEHLHQMRVGTRRLRTALQVFDSAVKLPKSASAKQLRKLARVLGGVRDLDVQMASLSKEYHPNLDSREQKKLNRVSRSLVAQRKDAFATLKQALTQRQFQEIKKAYDGWLEEPQYTAIAQLPLVSVLPDILSPLLSELFLHSGWLMSIHDISDHNTEVLHDLRKVCKHVRYQTEFFTAFYGDEFGNWVQEIKQIQDDLGAFQDTQVLQALLTDELGPKNNLPKLQKLIRQNQSKALNNWEDTRQKYLDSGFRYHLHEMLLQPKTRSAKVHPELLGQSAAHPNRGSSN